MDTIASRLAGVRERIARASSRRARSGADVQLVAVSKGHPAAAVREAFAAGQRLFGENYVQEMIAKAADLEGLELRLHFIGHLQRNKVRDVLSVADTIQTVDRADLAAEIAKRATRTVDVLLEINVGREPQKSGCSPEGAAELARAVAAHDKLRLRGLMTVPPAADEPEASRPFFRALRELGEELAAQGLIDGALELSMGMSHDFDVAIEEGATLVRVGTDIFGPRAPRS